MTFNGLCDGTVSVKTFFRAKKMAEFYNYIEEESAKNARKDEVEYFG